MGSFTRSLALISLGWCCLMATRARAETPSAAGSSATTSPREACLAEHEQAQDARLDGKLLEARNDLRQCSAATCPALVTRDCVAWLAEIEQQIPSVIFRATKDGVDLEKLRVKEGDQLLTDTLTGTPLELNPGPHHFIAELPDMPAQDATYVLQAGDKGRIVSFSFTSPAPVTSPSKAISGPGPRLSRPVPTLTWVLGGVAVAALATGGVLGGLALDKRSDVSKECSPLCTDREVQGVKRLALAADVSLGIGLVAAGLSLYTFAARPAIATGDLAPLPRFALDFTGTGLNARGSF
jgi:hypothetical protein